MELSGLSVVFLLTVAGRLISGQAVVAPAACGTANVRCIGLPAGCAAKNESSCDVLARVSTAGDLVHVELTAFSLRSLKLSLASRWIAVGFSEDGQMGKSPVVHCFEDGGLAQAKLTFNSDLGYFNEGWGNVTQTQLTPLDTSVNGNQLSCSVNLQRNIVIKNFHFDLAGTKHSLITATGPMVQGLIRMHDSDPETSFPDAYTF